MHLTWLLIKLTHTHRHTLAAADVCGKQSHFVIESGNLNESAGSAIDMAIVITIDIDIAIDYGMGKAIIFVVSTLAQTA